MEKDNKVLLGAVLILLVAMVSFSFNDAVTGEVTSSAASVSASPTQVYFNFDDLANRPTKIVTVTVNVREGSVENDIQLYRDTGEKVEAKKQICKASASTCSKGVYEVPVQVSSSLEEGDYFFRVSGRSFAKQNQKVYDSNKINVAKYTSSSDYQ